VTLIREYKKDDEKGIFNLWEKLFGSLLGKNDVFLIEKEWWDWRVLKNPCGKPSIFLALNEEEVIAHQMIEKFKLSCFGKEKNAYLSTLTMADPDFRGLLLLKLINMSAKKALEEGAIPYGMPNKESLPIFERFGWKNIGNIPILVRPLSFPFGILDLSLKNKNYEVKEIEKFDKSIDNFFDEIKSEFPIILKRDEKFLNWRYVQNPLKNYKKIIVYKEGKIEGFAVFRDGTLGGRKTGIIMDILSKDKYSFRILLNYIIKYFKNEKMKIISCFMIKNKFYNELLKKGFVRVPISFLPKRNAFVVHSEDPKVLNIKNWYLSYGDWDCL